MNNLQKDRTISEGKISINSEGNKYQGDQEIAEQFNDHYLCLLKYLTRYSKAIKKGPFDPQPQHIPRILETIYTAHFEKRNFPNSLRNENKEMNIL